MLQHARLKKGSARLHLSPNQQRAPSNQLQPTAPNTTRHTQQGVSLALSLHAPDQELRRTIVPSARAYPLDRLMAAVADYQAASGQRVFVEYVMLSGGWRG